MAGGEFGERCLLSRGDFGPPSVAQHMESEGVAPGRGLDGTDHRS